MLKLWQENFAKNLMTSSEEKEIIIMSKEKDGRKQVYKIEEKCLLGRVS